MPLIHLRIYSFVCFLNGLYSNRPLDDKREETTITRRGGKLDCAFFLVACARGGFYVRRELREWGRG